MASYFCEIWSFLFLGNLRPGEPSTRWGNPVQDPGGTHPGKPGPLTSKKLSKNPSRQSLVREKDHIGTSNKQTPITEGMVGNCQGH